MTEALKLWIEMNKGTLLRIRNNAASHTTKQSKLEFLSGTALVHQDFCFIWQTGNCIWFFSWAQFHSCPWNSTKVSEVELLLLLSLLKTTFASGWTMCNFTIDGPGGMGHDELFRTRKLWVPRRTITNILFLFVCEMNALKQERRRSNTQEARLAKKDSRWGTAWMMHPQPCSHCCLNHDNDSWLAQLWTTWCQAISHWQLVRLCQVFVGDF